MSQDNNGYNGWSNYETWLVSLHIDNDQYLHERGREEAINAKASYPRREDLEDLTKRSAEHELTEQLERMVRRQVEREDIDSLMVSDLVNGAINSVDFREIAESKLSEVGVEV